MPYLAWIAGGAALGFVLDRGANAAEQSAKLARWVVIGGAVYVAAKHTGAVK